MERWPTLLVLSTILLAVPSCKSAEPPPVRRPAPDQVWLWQGGRPAIAVTLASLREMSWCSIRGEQVADMVAKDDSIQIVDASDKTTRCGEGMRVVLRDSTRKQIDFLVDPRPIGDVFPNH